MKRSAFISKDAPVRKVEHKSNGARDQSGRLSRTKRGSMKTEWMDLRDTQKVKSTGLQDGFFMECKDEDGVKDDSFDSDLQKWIVSLTRQGSLEEKTGLGEKTTVWFGNGLQYQIFDQMPSSKLLYMWWNSEKRSSN